MKHTGFRTACVVGGLDIESQVRLCDLWLLVVRRMLLTCRVSLCDKELRCVGGIARPPPPPAPRDVVY